MKHFIISQERDLEMELGDDYILDLQSKSRFISLCRFRCDVAEGADVVLL